jgi:hypothetical protein
MHRLKCNEILEMGYLWLLGSSHKSIQSMTGHCDKTVTALLKFFRKLVQDSLDEDDSIIGGEGIIVEVDEAKFGKRKYNRGHRVEGVWVLGGVEKTPERRCFFIKVPNRTEDTLIDHISKHVLSGSLIRTDCFKSYHNLCNLFQHQQVNHSKNFKDPVSGCNTNSIEGTWNGIKMNIAPRQRVSNEIDDHLAEFIWRRKCSKNLWLGFTDALKEIEYL